MSNPSEFNAGFDPATKPRIKDHIYVQKPTEQKPTCDICRANDAIGDFRNTTTHHWAYMCRSCAHSEGVKGTGCGFGQLLLYSTELPTHLQPPHEPSITVQRTAPLAGKTVKE
jgi:hypothetical protein